MHAALGRLLALLRQFFLDSQGHQRTDVVSAPWTWNQRSKPLYDKASGFGEGKSYAAFAFTFAFNSLIDAHAAYGRTAADFF